MLDYRSVPASFERPNTDPSPGLQLNSAFQLTEHLMALYCHHTTRSEPSDKAGEPPIKHSIPITRETANIIAQPPAALLAAGSSEGDVHPLWLYELCRFLIQKTNSVVTALFVDRCSSQTCPEMRASEWQYLCAVHDPPKSCCAIDYACHTLDWASNVVTSPKYFPSRLAHTIPAEELNGNVVGQVQQMRSLTNIFRRVYRIYAHAWFQHREVFWRVEGRYGLYMLFKVVCDVYTLIPEDNYTIPGEAEGLPSEGDAAEESPRRDAAPAPDANRPQTILRRPESDEAKPVKRHRHTPSKGVPVATVVEEDEEDAHSDVVTVIDDSSPSSSTTTGEGESAAVDAVERGVEAMGLLEDEGGAKAEVKAGEESAKLE